MNNLAHWRLILTGFLGATFASGLALAGDCPGACPTDLNGDAATNDSDLGILLNNWGCHAPVCIGDINSDGFTNDADLGLLLSVFGAPCPTFDYPEPPADDEAYQIALEVLGPGGDLLPPDALVQRISTDLALIRAFKPALETETHTPAWLPTSLIVGLVPGQPQDQLACYNSYFGATLETLIPSLNIEVYEFPGALNMPVLAQIYSALNGVNYAEPNGLIGGQNFWSPSGELDGSGDFTWSVDDGFWDCFDGCDCHTYYIFTTTADGRVLLNLEQQFGQPWCEWPK